MGVTTRVLLALTWCLLCAAPALAQTPTATPEPETQATGVEAAEEAAEAAEEEEAGEGLTAVIAIPGVDGAEDTPVAGAEISVATADGEELGSAVTDETGFWQFPLPGPGSYTATIDPASVVGAELRNPDRATLEVEITPGQFRRLLFPLGEGGGGGGGGQAQLFLQLIVSGVKFGLIIAMAAIGLTLIFGTTGLVNFAHGEMVTLGTLLAFTFEADLGLNIFLAILCAMVAGALFGGFLDVGIFRPLRKRGTGLIAAMVISIGLSLLLRNVLLYVYGGRRLSFSAFAGQTVVQVGPINIVPRDLVIMGASLAILLTVALILQRTRIGKAMRAVADNRDLAESSGIDVQRVILVVWLMGGALAALGGVFQGLDTAVNFELGFRLLLLIFAGVTLGGLGTAYGALIGSLVVGVAVQVSSFWLDPELKNVTALAILILILLVRPQGILGRAERIG